ncbi:MAG: hypothetical protein U5K51_06400 [Flavobacteriaceae bacterium]|nr:hypothetical protein [Flavobacteriaceae bacterium]
MGQFHIFLPYISRGVISTRQVAQLVLSKGYKPGEIECFLKELAWRDYFQQVWMALGESINNDIKQPQPDSTNKGLSQSIANAALRNRSHRQWHK